MDPNACMDRIVRAITTQDDDELIDAIGDLRTWISNGGFAPAGYTTLAWRLVNAAETAAEERIEARPEVDVEWAAKRATNEG